MQDWRGNRHPKLYSDDDHLSAFGAEAIREIYGQLFNAL